MQPAVRGGFRLRQDEYRRNTCKYGILYDLTRLRKHRDGTMAELSLRMADGTEITVPSSLEAITTYVLLEQEKWFEKETAFITRWLRPGMNAIDLGANLRVYCADGAAGWTRRPGLRL
jgi:hypothetical protein